VAPKQALRNKQVFKQQARKLMAWRKEVDAQMMTLNP
jgi:hypothetical protein